MTVGKSSVAIESKIRPKSGALEFETMLRRHLKSGGAPVTVCAGFDFDSASAYLENALVGSQRASYESHLAGCATCRRHMVELARLARVTPRTEAQPATVVDQNPAWIRWREVVVGWFRPSSWAGHASWNWKWQIVGAAGAAFAVLIAALGSQLWRQAPKQADTAYMQASTTASEVAPSSPAPAPESSPQNEPAFIAGLAREPLAESRTTVPAPGVGPAEVSPNVPVAPSAMSLSLQSDQPIGALPPIANFNPKRDAATDSRESMDAFRPNFVSPQGTPEPPQRDRRNLSRPDLGNARIQAAQSESNEGTTRPTPSSKINPYATGLPGLEPPPQTPATGVGRIGMANPRPQGSALQSKTQPEKSSSRSKINPVDLWRSVFSFDKQGSKPEPLEKNLEKKKPAAADDDSFKTLELPLRGKVFHFSADKMWIDQDYNEETMMFRLTPLKRGSKDYERVLASNPELKEFFDHAPILIVWKNEVYRVR